MNAHVPSAIAAASSRTSAPEPEALAFRAAMRKLAGAVSIVTVGQGEARTGLTATSVSSLSVDPPSLLVSVNRSASAYGTLLAEGTFAINVLRPHHRVLADQFAGRGGLKGAARYAGAEWTRLSTGAPVLTDALSVFDCVLEDAIERHSHIIVIGRVAASRITESATPLLYWGGAYRDIAV